MNDEHSLIQAVHVITRLLASTLDTDEAIRQTLAVAIEAVGAEGGSVLLHEEPAQLLRFRHVVGPKSDQLMEFAIRENEGIAGEVFQTGRPQICNDIAQSRAHSSQVDESLQFQTRNTCTVPLCYAGGHVVGVLQLPPSGSSFPSLRLPPDQGRTELITRKNTSSGPSRLHAIL